MDGNSRDEITVVSPGSQVLFKLDSNLPPHLKIVHSSDGLLGSQVTAQDGALFPNEWRGKRYTPEFWSQHEDQILIHQLTPTFRRELEFGDNGSFLLYSTMTQATETRYRPPKEGDNTVRARLEEMKSQGPQFYHKSIKFLPKTRPIRSPNTIRKPPRRTCTRASEGLEVRSYTGSGSTR